MALKSNRECKNVKVKSKHVYVVLHNDITNKVDDNFQFYIKFNGLLV